MASEDALLLRNMRGASGEASVPLNVPEVEPEVVVEPEDGGSLVDLRSKYQGLSSTESRPMYRGFEVPAGMDLDRVNDWFAAIDVREDARERTESLSYRVPKAMSEAGRYFLGTHFDPEEEKRLQEEYGLDPVKGEPEFVKDIRGSGVRQVGLDLMDDPVGTVQKAHGAADEMTRKAILEDDPESARNLADIASLKDPSGASDIASAISSARLAYREPDKRGSHLTDVAISGAAGGIQVLASGVPLVGSLLSGARLKAAMRGADVADDVSDVAKVVPDAPAPVFEAAAEKLAAGLPDKIGVQGLEGMLGRTRHSKAGQVAEYTQDVKDKDTGKIIHKKGDKKLTKSGEEIVYPEYTYKDISASEWNDTKLDDFIETAKASGKKSISKDELIKHLDDNKVQIEEVRLGGTGSQEDALKIRKTDALDNVHDEAMSLATVLAPGKSVTDQVHRFSADPDHFLGLYIDYAKKVSRINIDVPDDIRDIILRISSADDSFPYTPALWKPEHAARVTEARNAVNAKLADPEYQKFVDQQHIDFSVVPASGVDPDLMKQANERILQYQNLWEASRILNDMPEVETRLAALRKFQDSSNFQEFKQANKAYDAASSKADTMFPQWEGHTLPGGTNYQEILLTVPAKKPHEKRKLLIKERIDSLQKQIDEMADYEMNILDDWAKSEGRQRFGSWSGIGKVEKSVRDKALKSKKAREGLEAEVSGLLKEKRRYESTMEEGRVVAGPELKDKVVEFRGSHHSHIPNVMAHIRTKTRIDSKGRKILFVEEIQSDWHQKGLKHGYQGQKIELGKAVEDSLQELQSAQKALLDWHKKNPEPPNRDRATLLSIERPLPDLVEAIQASERGEEFVSAWKKSLPKEDQDILDASQAYISKLDELSDLEKEAHAAAKRLQDDTIGSDSPFIIFRHEMDELGNIRFQTNTDGFVSSGDIRKSLEKKRPGRFDEQVPDAPLKDTKEWTALAIKRIFREAAEQGYDGVAFNRGDDVARIVGGVEEGQKYFYDKLIPSIAKKESFVPPDRLPDETTKQYQSRVKAARKARPQTTDAGLGEARWSEEDQKIISDLRRQISDDTPSDIAPEDFIMSPNDPDVIAELERQAHINKKIEDIYKNRMIVDENYPFFELTDKVRDRVVKPQKLYSLALPGIAVGAAAAEEEELSAAAALGAIGMGGMALYKGMKGARAADVAKTVDDAEKPDALLRKRIDHAVKAGSKTKKEAAEAAKLWKEQGVDSKYFKRWFKKSKIADSSGTPVRVYHGTNKNFDAFEVSGDKTGLYGQGVYVTVSPSVADGYASHVANQRWGQLSKPSPPVIGGGFESARGGSVIPGYVSVQNPLFVEDPLDGEVLRKMNDYFVERGYSGLDQDLNLTFRDLLFHIDEETFKNMASKAGVQRKLKKMVEEEGYDAVINSTESVFNASKDIDFKNAPHSMHIVLMNPTQFKSDIGNLGTFDPKDPRILYGAGAAVPAAAAVRSQRTEEEGNPAPDEPMEEAPYEPYYTGDDYVQSYELSDSRQVYDEQIGLQSRFDELTNELGMVEAEYYSLTDAERASKRGDVLHEWYNDRLDELSSVEEQLEPDGYLRFLKGEDYYYETSPYSLDDFDVRRAFDVTGSAGPKIAENIELRSAQELHQVGLFQSTVDMGGPMVHMSGRNGAMNRFVYNKAQEFNHPVQTIQLNRPDKLSLMKDIDNVQSLKDAGLISFLLYKELLGDVKLY